MGKFIGIVEVQSKESAVDPDNNEDINKLTVDICRHVVGMRPKTIGQYKAETESESNNDEVENESESVKADNEEIDQDAVQDLPEEKIKDDSTLMNQTFLMNPDFMVGEYLQLKGLEVSQFVRVECGEAIPGEEET